RVADPGVRRAWPGRGQRSRRPGAAGPPRLPALHAERHALLPGGGVPGRDGLARAAPVVVVCGLTFGDEGKGRGVDALVRRRAPRAVARWNGGPQAGHNVVAPDGRWHCFAQLGAGSFVPGVRTLLAPGMLVELEALAVERDVLAGKGARPAVTIAPRCVAITPMPKPINPLLQLCRPPPP